MKPSKLTILSPKIALSLMFLGLNPALADIYVPDSARVQVVGENILHNGMRTDISLISFDGSADQLLELYRREWQRSDGIGYKEVAVGHWKVISRMDGPELQVLQVSENAGKASGFLSTGHYPNREAADSARRFPSLDGTRTVSTTASDDHGKRGSTVILRNHYSLFQNTEFYRQALENQGWKLTHDDTNGRTQILFFISRMGQLEVAISAANDGSTVIFSNLVEG